MAEPTSEQVDAFCQLMPTASSFFADMPASLLNYYNNARQESSLDIQTIEELFPEIASANELDPMIDLHNIVVSYYDGDWSSYIGILAGCTWEVEHGLGIKVVNGVPAEFGHQDLVI